jgi:hypothetical protein
MICAGPTLTSCSVADDLAMPSGAAARGWPVEVSDSLPPCRYAARLDMALGILPKSLKSSRLSNLPGATDSFIYAIRTIAAGV